MATKPAQRVLVVDGEPSIVDTVGTSLCYEGFEVEEATTGRMALAAAQPSRPVEVSGDPLRLRQVVDNLLANVRAHTPPGTGCTVSVDAEGAEAVLSVRDEGPGMDRETAPRIFERFYRADPSRSRAHGGSGLGLSIVAALVEAHGGTVAADTGPGVGTAIVVRFPLVPRRDDRDDRDDRAQGGPGVHTDAGIVGEHPVA